MTGPLSGLRIIEIAGLGPAPFCGMMLADHGAEVVLVERPGGRQAGQGGDPTKDVLNRSRRSIVVDLKQPQGVSVVRDLVRTANGLIEGFRPGVMERLGLGPEQLLSDNPRLVYGRMTGWGQAGPYAPMAGHDINYIALSGVLSLIGRDGEKPTPPLNLVGDFGGGGLMLAFGMLAALYRARETGKGQIVDCAMVDGAALLAAAIWGFRAQGRWNGPRGTNLLDTGAHFYDTYECADGHYIAIGAIEPQFYAELRRRIGVAEDPDFDHQTDRTAWGPLKIKLAALFKTRTRTEWCAQLEGSDACFAPVLTMEEAPDHPHNAARDVFRRAGGVVQPAPAPRYSATPTVEPEMPAQPGRDGFELLQNLGYDPARIAALRDSGAVG
jgi:alpha-methylacyl-CoA racemase